MTTDSRLTTVHHVLGPGEGEIVGDPAAVTDRFMINGSATDGRLALVEHGLAPRALAAPMHRHSREDEYSYVLAGEVGAILGGQEIIGRPGDLIFKPRGQWHTFWNAGDEPARILEIITPAGLEDLFRELGPRVGDMSPEDLFELAGRYGCDLDFDATMPLVERHGLAF
ncbi:Uncharacterized conserved protein, contains double-stranded beta-helix domain [Alloactinosynnema sp. L-07]|uniref:cupin domain-containing protein n=1 Tax=Alloactinosynnema sp. L-07 TaxID=1653480 RepID=UPI00065F04D1|nr:cupin domain-containing protein [Alloactinosynnema sp. L-07]CRK62012.1 Uncharacterized conserved protein, contains double-stranded beta-helix domain [Alloactinosynnema sp. L-07]